EIEHRVSLSQLRNGNRVAAAQRGQHRRVGQLAALFGVVQHLAESRVNALAVGAAGPAAAAASALRFGNGSRRLPTPPAPPSPTPPALGDISNPLSEQLPPQASRRPRASTRNTPTCHAAHARANPRRSASSNGGTRSAATGRAARTAHTRKLARRSWPAG